MKTKVNNYIKLLFLIIIISVFLSGIAALPIEELLITNGLGYDIEVKAGNEIEFSIPTSYYTFENEKLSSCDVKKAVGSTIGMAREDRQNKVSTKFILGFEKVYLFSEKISENEIKTIADFLFTIPDVNDNGSIVVISGSAEDALKKHVKSSTCAADEIDGILRNLGANNFFPKHYNLMDLYTQTTQEGKSLVIPYMSPTEEGFEVKGLSLFKNYKMIGKLSMDEVDTFNILRENKVRGHIDLTRSSTEFLSFYGTSKRKVKCERVENKYKFLIEININGNITGNNMYENLDTDVAVKKEVEDEIAKKVEIHSKTIINKLQNQFRFDGLQLGSIAASKYGRHAGENWHEVVSNSEIEVKVKVHIQRTGRGNL